MNLRRVVYMFSVFLLSFVCMPLQGWVFNVVPWLVALPSSVLSGWISDNLLKQGESYVGEN